MEKALTRSKIFVGFHVIGWAIVIVFMAWLFSGCSGGGGGSRAVAPPPCVNEIVPCLTDEWTTYVYFYDEQGREISLISDGEELRLYAPLWFQDHFYWVTIWSYADTCTEGSPFLLYHWNWESWYEIEGTLEICDDILRLEIWEPGSRDVNMLEGEIKEETPTALK